ncbi:hypothetical protein B5V91_06640 [Heyndrickxia sporothermodurans]|nr:hypothetical protein B5V91_06640 [Heyndrickxia sporothermodurans]
MDEKNRLILSELASFFLKISFSPFALRMVQKGGSLSFDKGQDTRTYPSQSQVHQSTGQGGKTFLSFLKNSQEKKLFPLTLDLLPILSVHSPCQKGKNNSLWELHSFVRQKRREKTWKTSLKS